MARIDVLPSIEIIRGLKGILDFYMWRGLPCVRAWPTYRPAKQTAPSLAAALTFGAIIKAYALLANLALQAYRQDALHQPRTARDIMVTGVFGNLHEASMSDFLDALIIIRDAVVTLTDLLHALDSVDTDEIVVNVDQSVLPPLAATTTNQASMIAALQKIDDLQDALESNALDRLLVRGMDQLFSLKEPWLARVKDTNATAPDETLASAPVTAGQVWILTHVAAFDNTSNITRIEAYVFSGIEYLYLGNFAPTAIKDFFVWDGFQPMPAGAVVVAEFFGVTNGDDIFLECGGIKMTLET